MTLSVESVLKSPKDEVLFGHPQSSTRRFPAKEEDIVSLRHGVDCAKQRLDHFIVVCGLSRKTHAFRKLLLMKYQNRAQISIMWKATGRFSCGYNRHNENKAGHGQGQ